MVVAAAATLVENSEVEAEVVEIKGISPIKYYYYYYVIILGTIF